MRIKHELVPLHSLDQQGRNEDQKMNFRLERPEVDGRIEQAEKDIAEARADTSLPPEAIDARVSTYERKLAELTGLRDKIDAAGGSFAYMPQSFIDTFSRMSAPARSLAVNLAMLTGKLDGDLTPAEINGVMLKEYGPPQRLQSGELANAWHRALYGEVIAAVEKASAKAASLQQPTDLPTGGNPLTMRIQTMTTPKAEPKVAGGAQTAALASIAAQVPRADAIGQSTTPDAIAALLADKLADARNRGDDQVTIWPDELDSLIGPINGADEQARLQSYAQLADVLNRLGYPADSTGDNGLRFQAIADRGDSPELSKEAFQSELSVKLPSPPTADDGGARVGELLRDKIQSAHNGGEDFVSIKPRDLNPALKPTFSSPSKAYGRVAEELEKLGYRSSADGFAGVAVLWVRPANQTTTIDEVEQKIVAALPPAQQSAADRIADLVKTKVAAAQREGRKDFDLETGELNRILGPIYGAGHKGYEPVAQALIEQGFQAFADGFIGVNAGWED